MYTSYTHHTKTKTYINKTSQHRTDRQQRKNKSRGRTYMPSWENWGRRLKSLSLPLISSTPFTLNLRPLKSQISIQRYNTTPHIAGCEINCVQEKQILDCLGIYNLKCCLLYAGIVESCLLLKLITRDTTRSKSCFQAFPDNVHKR